MFTTAPNNLSTTHHPGGGREHAFPPRRPTVPNYRTNRYVRGPVKGIFQTMDFRSAQQAQACAFDLEFWATGLSMSVRNRSIDWLQRRIR
jgi:hypothetical protein